MNRGWNQPDQSDKLEVTLGDRAVGPGQPAFIIAEAGVNHNGQLDLALQLVQCAKRCGADAVKFQVFTAEGLVVANAPTADYQAVQGHGDQRQMLRELELTRQEFVDLFWYCKDVGIEFLATPFSIGDLEFLLDLGVRTIKLASTDLINLPLVERAIAAGLPIIASTGACILDEIDAAVDLFANHDARSRLVLMHCVSSYPTPLIDANLAVMPQLAQRYDMSVGYSDHTAEWITGALAVAAGARVLEKHFTIDRALPGPDQSFSLEESHLMQYVAAVREAEAAMGTGQRAVLPCEEQVRTVSRGSVVAATDIPTGTVVTPAMLTVKRPGGGIEPARIKSLVGLVPCRDIPADTILSWDMLQPAESPAFAGTS